MLDTDFKSDFYAKEYSKQCYVKLIAWGEPPLEVRYWYAPNIEKECRLVRDKLNLDNILENM